MVSEGYLPYHPNPKKPDLTLPRRACDAHCHVFGPSEKFPYSEHSCYIPYDAPKEVLFQRHNFLGIDRGIIVQASCHGTDNSAMLDALIAGGDNYRGIAIVDPDITYQELERMHECGVRGVRFNFLKRLNACQPEEARKKIINKIIEFPWHVVVYLEPEDLPEIKEYLLSLPVPIIIDHMGRLPVDKGIDSPEFFALADILSNENFWIKVSCPERLSSEGAPYNDVNAVAMELIHLFSDRVLWGTDWPHPNMRSHIPDDGKLIDKLSSICPDKKMLNKILVDNPDRLYWAL